MKRILCFIMTVVMTLAVFSPFVSANTDNEQETLFDSVSFFCTYDSQSKQVVIDGTVNHDVMISHKDYVIRVFVIHPGESEDSVLNSPDTVALAESSMTVRFTFYIEAKTTVERYSKYVIIFTSPEGVDYVAGRAKHPSVSSHYEYDADDHKAFKGLSIDSSFFIGELGAGTVIIDFKLNEAKGDISNSYLYPSGDSYFYIKKSYIEYVDKRMTAAAMSGANVYLRLLLDADDDGLASLDVQENTEYSLPYVYYSQVIDFVAAVVEFTSERYDDDGLYGFVVGFAIDTLYKRTAEQISCDEYSDMYTLYLTVVGSAARTVDDSLDIVIPLSDEANLTDDGEILSSVLLESIIKRLNDNVSGNFDCSLIIESDYVPSNIFKEESVEKKFVTPDNVGEYIGYVASLEERFDSVPLHVIYKWTPPKALVGNRLCCSYIYAYLKLIEHDAVSSFVVELDENNIADIRDVLTYIDTENKINCITPYAKYLGVSSWQEIIGNEVDVPTNRTLLKEEFYTTEPDWVKGEFCYVDFSSSSVFELMKKGQNCSSLISEYDASGERVLRIVSDKMSVGEYMDTVCFFECEESYVYTDTLSLMLGVEENGKNKNNVYELTVTLGNADTRIDAFGTVRVGETAVLYFDVDDFSELSTAAYMRISVRCLTGDTDGVSLVMYDLKGYSAEYNSEELGELINELRLRMQGIDSDDGGWNKDIILTVIAVLISMIAVGIGLFIVFRRDEENSKE